GKYKGEEKGKKLYFYNKLSCPRVGILFVTGIIYSKKKEYVTREQKNCEHLLLAAQIKPIISGARCDFSEHNALKTSPSDKVMGEKMLYMFNNGLDRLPKQPSDQ
uniref:Uncharacterized protein n=1 Tax=Glossina pallidipes TaxID=7398 RepID=A0A1A9ZMJ0_GLOPL